MKSSENRTISNQQIRPLPIREYRTGDARFDAAIEDYTLREAGVIEDDQPTEYSDYVWRKQWNERNFGEFTAEERGAIRMALGLGTFGD